MRIYTGYFAILQKLKNPVSICAIPPKWSDCPNFKLLAPSKDILLGAKSGEITQDQYTKRFNAYLKTLDQEEVLQQLKELVGSKTITLVCFEKTNDFCHRHLVADWLEPFCTRIPERQTLPKLFNL